MTPYRVFLTENNESIVFSCHAESETDAEEQAIAAYPSAEVAEITLDLKPLNQVLFSPKEFHSSDDQAGFWSAEDGWTTLDGATKYSEHYNQTELKDSQQEHYIFMTDALAMLK